MRSCRARTRRLARRTGHRRSRGGGDGRPGHHRSRRDRVHPPARACGRVRRRGRAGAPRGTRGLGRGAPRPRRRPARLAPGSGERRPGRPGVRCARAGRHRARERSAYAVAAAAFERAAGLWPRGRRARPSALRGGGRGVARRRRRPHARAARRCANAPGRVGARRTHRPPPRPGGDAARAGHGRLSVDRRRPSRSPRPIRSWPS